MKGDKSKIPDPNQSEHDLFENNFQIPKTQYLSNKKLFLIITAVFIIILVIVFKYFVLNEDFQSSIINSTDKNELYALKQKELELKEKELQLRENKLTNSGNKESLINDKFYDWLNAIQNNTELSKYYADYVNYYSTGYIPLSKVLADKRKFYEKWDKRRFDADKISVSFIGDDKYRIIYDKSFECENTKEETFYNGKVRSVLVFTNIHNEMLINEEYDESIYYSNKNR